MRSPNCAARSAICCWRGTMCVGVPDDFENEVTSVLRAESLRTSAAHDAMVLARARQLCAPARLHWPRRAVPFALAAGLALIMGAYLKYGAPIADNGLVRSAQSADQAALVPANGARLSAAPNEFAWPE